MIDLKETDGKEARLRAQRLKEALVGRDSQNAYSPTLFIKCKQPLTILTRLC